MIQIVTLIDGAHAHDATLEWARGGLEVNVLGERKTVSVGEAVRLSLPVEPQAPLTVRVITTCETFTIRCPDKIPAFLDVVGRDLHDLIVREIMRVPGVKSEDMWRLSLASRFTATHMNDREHLFAKCACIASFCPTLLAYLTFFRTSLHFANRVLVDDIVRYGRAIFMLQARFRKK